MKYNFVDYHMEGIYLNKRISCVSHYQRLVHFIDDLILNFGKYSGYEGYSLEFNNLSDDDQGQLVALKIEADDRDTSECFYQSNKHYIDDDITCALLNLLITNSPEKHEYFSNLVRKHSINQYSSFIQNLIDERCGLINLEVREGCVNE